MRTFVKSLKRLYDKGSINTEYLSNLLTENKISAEELEYILGE